MSRCAALRACPRQARGESAGVRPRPASRQPRSEASTPALRRLRQAPPFPARRARPEWMRVVLGLSQGLDTDLPTCRRALAGFHPQGALAPLSALREPPARADLRSSGIKTSSGIAVTRTPAAIIVAGSASVCGVWDLVASSHPHAFGFRVVQRREGGLCRHAAHTGDFDLVAGTRERPAAVLIRAGHVAYDRWPHRVRGRTRRRSR
jgi:hypothetical protein